jgi:hypothetical protein
MSWLLRDDDVLAVIEDRRKGWRDELQGVVLVPAPAVLHTFACAQALDAAWCKRVRLNGGEPGYRVRKIHTLDRHRMAPPHLTSGVFVVAAGGAFERWKLQTGDELEVRQV